MARNYSRYCVFKNTLKVVNQSILQSPIAYKIHYLIFQNTTNLIFEEFVQLPYTGPEIQVLKIL